MVKGHGLHRSEHLTFGEAVVRDGADELPAVVDADLPVVLLDADGVAGQAAADEDAVAVERDLAAGADAADGPARLVLGFGQGGRAAARAWAASG